MLQCIPIHSYRTLITTGPRAAITLLTAHGHSTNNRSEQKNMSLIGDKTGDFDIDWNNYTQLNPSHLLNMVFIIHHFITSTNVEIRACKNCQHFLVSFFSISPRLLAKHITLICHCIIDKNLSEKITLTIPCCNMMRQ